MVYLITATKTAQTTVPQAARKQPKTFTTRMANAMPKLLAGEKSRRLTITIANTVGLIMTAPFISWGVRKILGRVYDLGEARHLYLDNRSQTETGHKNHLERARDLTLTLWADDRMDRIDGYPSRLTLKQRIDAFTGKYYYKPPKFDPEAIIIQDSDASLQLQNTMYIL